MVNYWSQHWEFWVRLRVSSAISCSPVQTIIFAVCIQQGKCRTQAAIPYPWQNLWEYPRNPYTSFVLSTEPEIFHVYFLYPSPFRRMDIFAFCYAGLLSVYAVCTVHRVQYCHTVWCMKIIIPREDSSQSPYPYHRNPHKNYHTNGSPRRTCFVYDNHQMSYT